MKLLRSSTYLIVGILFISTVLRLLLASQGGQYFFGDEGRYQRGIELFDSLRAHDFPETRTLLSHPEHQAFVWVGALVTLGQVGYVEWLTEDDWDDPASSFKYAPVAAALLGTASTACLYLIFLLVRTMGGTKSEAIWALSVAAASNTLLYSSRHLLPYDWALLTLLAGLIFASRPGWRSWLISGVFAGVSYHIYNGYWFSVPVTGLWFVCAHITLRRNLVRASGYWILGVMVGLGFALGLGWWAGGPDYWRVMLAFSGTVNQGLFSEGAYLPWKVWFHSEGLLGVLLLAATVLGLFWWRGAIPRFVAFALLGFFAVYGCLIFMSVGLEKFVVYARSCRPMLPFIAIVAGWMLSRLCQQRWQAGLAGLLLGATLLGSFVHHLGRVFPRDVEQRVLADFGVTKRWISFSGSLYRPLALPVSRPDLGLGNTLLIYPVREFEGRPAGEVIFSLDHPLNYFPFQYESHTPRERSLLRQNPPRMELIRLAAPEEVPDHPPWEDIYQATDRPDGYDRQR